MSRTLIRSGARVGLVALLAFVGTAHAEDEPAKPKEGVTCRHWSVLLPEDAGQHRVYDGIRKGLELAQLERVCLKDVADDEASFASFVAWHKALPEPAPLVFAIGRRAGARLTTAGYAGPGVLASAEMTAGGKLIAPDPTPGPRMARVRAEVTAEAWGSALRDLLGLAAATAVRVDLAWFLDLTNPRGKEAAKRFAAAAGLHVLRPIPVGPALTHQGTPAVPPDPADSQQPQAVLHVRMGVGEHLLPFADALARAQQLRVPLLCDDPARFGTGATLLVVPDHQRLGRMAAEAGRRLWRHEPNALEPLVVRSTEVWVDLVAAEAIGLEPPLTFLASADRVRSPVKRPASAPGAPR